MKIETIATLSGEGYDSRIDKTTTDLGDELIEFPADMDIDGDGSDGNPDNDPDFQNETSLKHSDGTSLNSSEEAFIVVPPVIPLRTNQKVLGSLAFVENTVNHLIAFAVVGDIGPTRKDGEGSKRLAELLMIPSNARNGGVDKPVIRYTIFVGVPAVVGGRQYQLKSY
jgi:hypothetical protein